MNLGKGNEGKGRKRKEKKRKEKKRKEKKRKEKEVWLIHEKKQSNNENPANFEKRV